MLYPDVNSYIGQFFFALCCVVATIKYHPSIELQNYVVGGVCIVPRCKIVACVPLGVRKKRKGFHQSNNTFLVAFCLLHPLISLSLKSTNGGGDFHVLRRFFRTFCMEWKRSIISAFFHKILAVVGGACVVLICKTLPRTITKAKIRSWLHF